MYLHKLNNSFHFVTPNNLHPSFSFLKYWKSTEIMHFWRSVQFFCFSFIWRNFQLTLHWRHVTMSAIASQITGISTVCSNVCSHEHHWSKKTPMLRVTGLCMGIQLSPGGFPSQRACARKWFHLMKSSWLTFVETCRSSIRMRKAKISIATITSQTEFQMQT